MNKEELRNSEAQPEGEIGTREKIIAAALSEFAEHGRAGARVDRIAAVAGVNKAMIYYHFNSKDELYLQVLKSFFHDIGRRAHLMVAETGSLEDALLAVAALHAGIVTQNPQVRTILLRELADHNPEIIEAITGSFQESGMVDIIRERVTVELESGTIRPIDPRHLISGFIGLSLGYYFLYPIADRLMGVEDRAKFIEARKKIIVDIFLNGIKVR